MKTFSALPFLGLGVMACLALLPTELARSASGLEDGPVLVVAPPWSGGAEAVVRAAGGRILGPTRAPLSVLATGASAQTFRSAGAWAVLDPDSLNLICSSKDAP